MRLLVTGSTGFIGRALMARLTEAGHEAGGVSRSSGLDVTDPAALAARLGEFAPEGVYHLAGPSFVPDSKRDPAGTWAVHAGGTLNLLEAARSLPAPPRILLLGTADSYRPDPARRPFDEETPIEPENPYAAAKLAQEALGMAWHRTWGLPVVRVRLFNLIGPGQGERFVASNFGRQAAAIRLGLQPPRIEVGDLRVARDFIDWRDGIAAIIGALEQGRPGEVYNIATGRAVTLRTLLDTVLDVAGIDPEIVSPAELDRPGQALVRCGSAEKLRRETGWVPRRTLRDSVEAIVADWMERLARDAGRSPGAVSGG